MWRKWVARLFLLLLVSYLWFLVGGCAKTLIVTQATPTPTPTVSPTPTPTGTPTPTPTPTPTGSPFGMRAVSPTPIPSSTPTPTPIPVPTPSASPTAAMSRFIYGTPGFEAGAVQAGVINSNGKISPVRGSPFDEGLGQTSIIQVVADRQGRFVYVLNVGASAVGEIIGQPGIAGFSIDRATGALIRAPGSPIVFPTRNDNEIAIDGSGHFLFEPNLSNTGFDVYVIDQSSGGLTKTSSTSNVPPLGSSSAASPDGRFLFNAGSGMVEVFSIDPQSGALSAIGTPVSTAGSGGPMAITQDGKFLYAGNKNEGTLAIFAIGTDGSLSPRAGSPFAIDTGAQFLTLTPDGRFLYVAFFNPVATVSAVVKGYGVNPSAGTFTPIAGAVARNAESITIDLSGQRAYISFTATQFSGLNLSIYNINPASGVLTQIGQAGGPVSDDPFDMATTP